MNIQISRDGQTFGPYSLDQLQQNLDGGSIFPTDLAWFEGAPQWMPVSQVPGIRMPVFSKTAPPALPPRPTQTSTSGTAVCSLIFGILAWVFLPIIGALVAVVTGHIGLSGINRSDGQKSGRGLAIGGLVLGYVNLVLLPIILLSLAVPTFNVVQEKANQMATGNNARQVVMACKVYAVDHGGSFPPSLDALVPEYIEAPEVLQSRPPSEDGDVSGFEYTTGLTDSDPGETVVLQSKRIYRLNKRVIARLDGSFEVIKEE